MKAFLLHKYGPANAAFQFSEVPEPLVGHDQVKIKVESFGLNFADVMARRGLYRDAPPLPAVLGYEAVGIVTEQGKNVADNFIGKKVLAFTRFGGYAQYAVTGYQAIVPVDEKYDNAKLLALATQYCTAYYAAFIATTVQPGDVVLQHAAAGGVGTALTQLCILRGAKVVGLVSNDQKLAQLKTNGCEAGINYKKEDYVEAVRKRFGKVDVSFNSVAGTTFKKDLSLLNKGGRLVCYGGAERMSGGRGFLSTLFFVFRMGRIIPVKLLINSQSLIGVNMLRIADHRPDILQTCMQEVYKLFIEGKINPVVGIEYKADQLPVAHAAMEKGETIGKIAIHF